MQKIKNFITNNKILWGLFYLLIFSILINNSFNYLDPDLGWHLRVGSDIYNEKQVPNFENYNYTLDGKTWVDHEWLINLFSFQIFERFDYFYLSLFFSLLAVAVLIFLTVFTKKYFLPKDEGNFLIMFVQFFAILAMCPHLGVRMQEITLLNLLLVFIIIFLYSKNRNYKILFWLPLLLYFWANVHAGFLIGLFTLFFFIGVKILENILPKIKSLSFIEFENVLNLKEITIFFIFSALAAFVTFLTPYGLDLFDFLKTYTNTFYLTMIVEWFPAWQWPIVYYQMIYLAISVIVLFYIFSRIYYNRKNKIKINLWHLAAFSFFLLLAFKSRRHFPLFFIASFPVFIRYSSPNFELPEKMKNFLKNNFFINLYAVLVLVVISLFFILSTNFCKNPFNNEKFCGEYPCQALEFIKSDPALTDLKLFNDYNWGGYLTWTYPEKKIFIDGRLPQFEYENHTLFQEYNNFFVQDKAEKMLDKHDIQIVLLKKSSKTDLNWFDKNFLGIEEDKINTEDYLEKFLNSSQKWELLYTDDISSVYVKKQ